MKQPFLNLIYVQLSSSVKPNMSLLATPTLSCPSTFVLNLMRTIILTMATNIGAIEELLESIDNDESSWTKRGVVKLVTTQSRYLKQIKHLEKEIDRWTWRSGALQTIETVSAYFATGGTGVSAVREAVMSRDGFIAPSTIYWIVLVITVVATLLVNCAAQLQKTLNYPEAIASAGDCINDLRIQINDINVELYRKAETRTSLSTMLLRIQSDEAKIQRRLTNSGVRSYLQDTSEADEEGEIFTELRYLSSGDPRRLAAEDQMLMTASTSTSPSSTPS